MLLCPFFFGAVSSKLKSNNFLSCHSSHQSYLSKVTHRHYPHNILPQAILFEQITVILKKRTACEILIIQQGSYKILQKIIQQIHTLNFLLKIRTSVNIQRKRYIFVSENFRKRFYIKLWYLNSSDSKGMANFMEFYFF